MEFLKIVRRRSFLSEFVYIALNVALAVGIVLLIRATESPWPAIGLVLLSKWRVFAVRPRFWYVNLQSNLVDYMVGISFATFLYLTYVGEALSEQKTFLIISLMVLYMTWLIFIKPRSKRIFVVAQAGVALFSSVAVLFTLAYSIPLSIVIGLMWLIGYATSKHVLTSYDDEAHGVFLSQLWGLVVAEVGWIAYHWTEAYSLFGFEEIIIPRVALSVLCLGFIVYKSYDSHHRYGRVRSTDVILPIIFTFGVIVILPIILSLLGIDTAVGI